MTTTLRQGIVAALTGNSGWTTLVTGGTKFYEDYGPNGLEPNTSVVDSNGRLKLTCVLTMGARQPAEIKNASYRGFVKLWVYHDSSYELVEQAQDLAFTLLNKTRVTVTGKGTPMLYWVDNLQEFSAQELGDAAAGCSRYALQYRV